MQAQNACFGIEAKVATADIDFLTIAEALDHSADQSIRAVDPIVQTK